MTTQNMDYARLDEALAAIRGKWPAAKPACGFVLGSGWSDVAEALEIRDTMSYTDIPGLGATGVAGHAGRLVWGSGAGVETFVFQGRRHWYEGEGWTPIALPLYVLKQLGAQHVVLTNAAGGINPGFKVGDLMVIDDHINWMFAHVLPGPHNPVWGPRFPDQSNVYAPELRDLMDKAAAASGILVRHGVYLATSGPTYETPAEIRMFGRLGADAVGMSTIPEAVLASAAGMKVAAISCISNLAAGISKQALSHEEVAETTNRVMGDMKKLLLQFLKELAATS